MFDRTALLASGLLDVGGGQRIYWEESGSATGIPAVYLHGGPGGTLGSGSYRERFDPARFRIIGLDQRGCGRSLPLVTAPGYDLGTNTTAQLIEDLEALRAHLGVERWLVSGVSWGSTLAIAYAQAHPARVLGVVAMAVTTTDRFQVDWITETVGAIFPEAWDRLATHAERAGIGYRRGEGRLVEAYATLLTHDDRTVREGASRAWVDWEDHHVSIGEGGVHPNPHFADEEFRHVFATLVTHYWAHDAFLDPPLLERMDRLAEVPATLIHGRLDVSGPTVVPWRLHRAWPGSELVVVEGEGHGGTAMVEAWCEANSRHAERIDRAEHSGSGGGGVLELRPVRRDGEWRAFAELVREYVASLPFALDFQDIDRELEHLRDEYGPPGGAAFLARLRPSPPVATALAPSAAPAVEVGARADSRRTDDPRAATAPTPPAVAGEEPLVPGVTSEEQPWAGCVALRVLEPGVGELKRMYVRPDARGLGLGRALAEAAVEAARARALAVVRLDTVAAMRDAIGLYRRIGFAEIPPYRHNPLADARFFELRLAGDGPVTQGVAGAQAPSIGGGPEGGEPARG